MPMQNRFQHLFAVISGQRFLNKQGLGNEAPFFICPFKPEESVEMERLQRQLVNRLEQTGVRILEINLYDLSIEILKERGIWNQIVEMEKSILFDIDQKADVISKTQIDALLAVFVKVFDEMCGYYGKQGHIAQFERDLDSRGLYEQFKSAYESVVGRTWQKGREQALLEAKNIAKAYAQATGGDETSAMGILDKYRSQYRVSIEDFAEQVHTYIERQWLLAMMVEMATPVAPTPEDTDEPTDDASPKVGEPKIEYVHTRKVRVSYDKAWLANEADVDHYLESLREALLEEIRKGKRIQI
jgi:hypothetical protein